MVFNYRVFFVLCLQIFCKVGGLGSEPSCGGIGWISSGWMEMLKGCGGEIQKGIFCIDFPLSYFCIRLVSDVATLSLMLVLEV